MKTAKQAAELVAAKLGIELAVGGGRYFEIVADAPAGMVFVTRGLHCLVFSSNGEQTSTQVWREVYSELKQGLRACECHECEHCSIAAVG